MSAVSALRRGAMWRCPACSRKFANRNQSHACGPRHTLASHFKGKPPTVRAIFNKLLQLARKNGPVTVLPEKTRIAFHVRMSFAAFVIRKNWVDGHVVLARRLENPRFCRVETFSLRNHLHAFRFEDVTEVDEEVSSWLAEAYQVGQQRHLIRQSARNFPEQRGIKLEDARKINPVHRCKPI